MSNYKESKTEFNNIRLHLRFCLIIKSIKRNGKKERNLILQSGRLFLTLFLSALCYFELLRLLCNRLKFRQLTYQNSSGACKFVLWKTKPSSNYKLPRIVSFFFVFISIPLLVQYCSALPGIS